MSKGEIKIVTICGSSRFCDVMAVCGWLLERDEGVITMGLHYLPPWYEMPADHGAEHEGVADAFDDLHLKKIAMSDEIFVVNVNGYIGDSTRREVGYANGLGLPIRFYDTDPLGARVNVILQDAIARASPPAPS